MDAQSPHLLERGDAAGELGVRAGVRDGPEPAIAEDLQIVLRHVHAVEAAAAVIKVAEGIKQLRRRLAPAAAALGHLARGLGNVREHRRVQRAGQFAGLGHLGEVRGILRVQAELIGDQRVQGVEFAVLALELLRAAAAPAQHQLMRRRAVTLAGTKTAPASMRRRNLYRLNSIPNASTAHR